jgi:SNF2 family DNA or RNA helicase
LTLTVGTRVRRSSGPDEGVVVGSHDAFVDVAFATGTVTVHVDDVVPVFGSAADRLASGQLGDPEVYGLRLQQMFLDHAYRYDPLSGLSNARVEPAPHQVFVAHRVMQKVAPRMILADEVGLGKTIEAGLILKELRARRAVERVLIVTPASLMLQWQHELRSKFNESFNVIDGEAAKYLGRGGENPFSKQVNVLCSLPFAANPKRAEQIVEAGWDLVIFDEAHRVRRTRRRRIEIT